MLILLLCRRVAVAGLHCLLPSASNVLPSTFNLSGEVTSVSAAKCLLMYCQVPSICLGESLLCLCFSRALISSAKSFVGSCCFWTELCVVPAPVQESYSRRAALSAAKCLLMYCQVPSICLGESLLCLGSPKFFNNSVCWVIPLFLQGPDFVRQIFL